MEEWESGSPVGALRLAYLGAIVVISVAALAAPSFLNSPMFEDLLGYVMVGVLMATSVASNAILWLAVFPAHAKRDELELGSRAQVMHVLGIAFANATAIYGLTAAIFLDVRWIALPFAALALVQWAAVPGMVRHFLPEEMWRRRPRVKPGVPDAESRGPR